MTDQADQREFLLRSLEDLEREHKAGDLAEEDYRALKDDYTARAAAALRAEQQAVAARPRARRGGLVLLAGVIVFATLAGVLVAQASGRRDPGETVTGDITQSTTEKLNQAGRCFREGDAACAIRLYDEVLEDQPTNAEALTYKGWALYQLEGDTEAALTTLIDAATADRDYPDVHVFLAVVFFRSGLVQQAANELDRLEALDPPPDLLELTEELRAEVDAALAGGDTTTTAGG
jgi:tetratricopeptide (TPR) repeat protein